ncbi:UDP-phosphate N-acetylglucosaminyl-1-phosphate transferase [Dyella thiooxydans]|uniref:UDP-phosphate N-acetylglucosaminyl-1-phosphate transferase n=1 Tax=Dyella thiooxydans TaxID=445710 RepID=A0A160N2Z4_9GAMM|nr:MraY family glycosyltransferase [Dyella thiooxydans]AND69808.1 UDP-phosphate N-acetylglucosaminyl-1-phosphate transferase [Dyella thiooxydans]
MLHLRVLASCATALLFCAATLALVYGHAPALGLIDHPDGRKKHLGHIPLIGGIAVFTGVLCGACVAGQADMLTCVILGTTAILALTGVLDDRFELGVLTRLLVQAAAVLTVIGFTGLHIHTLGRVFGVELELGVLGIPLTLLAVIGLLNAFNMMDGIDGLAGMLAITSTGAIVYFLGLSMWSSIGLLLLLSAALLPYLAANLGLVGRKVFLGDAGSVVLGYLLAWTLIRLSQQAHPQLSTVDVLWCVALPVLDTLAVMIRRLGEHRSPFKPDRGHIHHLLLDAGIGPGISLALLIGLAIVFVCFGAQTSRLNPGSNLLAFGALSVIYIAAHGGIYRRQRTRRVTASTGIAHVVGTVGLILPRARALKARPGYPLKPRTAATSRRPPAPLL